MTVEISRIADETFCKRNVAQQFRRRLEKGGLTREENPQSHFCSYFAVIDPKNRRVFMGHHKKSGLWLFNGGHIDPGETPPETVVREFEEELGLPITQEEIGEPFLLTITPIDNPDIQTCREHFDIWYAAKVDPEEFNPNLNLLQEEFHENGWLSITEARNLVEDPNTLYALEVIENTIFLR